MELLVSITVIIALVALAFPASQGMRARTQQIQCVVNLQAIGVGHAIYAGQNNGDWAWVGDINARNDIFYRNSYEFLYYPKKWPGLGKIYQTDSVQKQHFFCPSDKSARVVRAFRDLPNWVPDPSMSITATYLTRTHEQTENYEPLGKKLGDISRRAVFACYFQYDPSSKTESSPMRVLNYHPGGWPTLYGDGSVKVVPIPNFIDPKNPPTIQSVSSLQIRIWNEMDH